MSLTACISGADAGDNIALLVERAIDLIRPYAIVCTNERQLQDAVAFVLSDRHIRHEREARLGPADRVDFLLAHGIGIELKTKGSVADVAEQLQRYAASPKIRALVLFTTRQAHAALPLEISGKPVRVLVSRGGLS